MNILPGLAPVTAAATKKQSPTGGDSRPEHEVDHHHDAEMPGIDVVDVGCNRQQDRHRHDQAGNAIDHRADDQQDDVADQHEADRVLGGGLDPAGGFLRHLAEDQHPGEHRRGRHQEQHDRRIDGAAQHHLRQLRELEFPGPVFPDKCGGDRADRSGFRRIGEAAEDGADDDDRDQQGG
ncbi:hypothetical protein ACVWZR_008885 [Bradyrhizobium sp. i1.3.1]